MKADSAVMRATAIALMALALAAPGWARTAWDEAAQGDLSNDGLVPTPVSMTSGDNLVLGVTGNQGAGVDRDYFKIVVPAGNTLSAIKLLPNTSVAGSVSFIGIQPGPQVTVSPAGAGADQLIALGHYGNEQVGTDILPSIILNHATLGAGTYSVWVQDTGGTAPYGFNFVMTPVQAAVPPISDAPLPPWALIALGAGLVGLTHRTRRASLTRHAGALKGP